MGDMTRIPSRPQPPYWLDPYDPDAPFPDPERACIEPNGLLALGGDLHPTRLLNAYANGIFPWYSREQPVLWWSPDPRTVLLPDQIHCSRSLKKSIRKRGYTVSSDRAFDAVVEACAAPRRDTADTWIHPEMKSAYRTLHRMGWAHSVEIWASNKLVGGLYGIAIGNVFFGESMFSRQTDASKCALVSLGANLARSGFVIIDCQMRSNHLLTMGAFEIARKDWTALLQRECQGARRVTHWPAKWIHNSERS